MHVHVLLLEGTTRGNVEVAAYFVDNKMAVYIATLVRLRLKLVDPTLAHTLKVIGKENRIRQESEMVNTRHSTRTLNIQIQS